MMKKLIPIAGISILAVVAAKAQDTAKVDSKHYKVLLDNEYVRVLVVHYKPGEKSPTPFATSNALRFLFPQNATLGATTSAGFSGTGCDYGNFSDVSGRV